VLTFRPLLCAVLLLVGGRVLAAPAVTATFDQDGLTGLSYGNAQFLKSGALRVGNVFSADENGKDVAVEAGEPTVSFERTAQRLSYSRPWGAVRCRYTVAEDRLNLELTIENDTAGPMSGVELSLLDLQLPKRPLGTPWQRRFEMPGDNDGELTVLPADFGSGLLTFCQEDPGVLIRSEIVALATPSEETWSVRVTSPDPYGERQVFVPPRSSKTFHFSLRFSPPGVPTSTVVRDLIEKFTAAHPFRLKWPDRRPIGMLMLSSNAHLSPTNPRGWFSDPKLDFTGKGGVKRFREKLLEAADRSIAILRDMGAQGMIFWDMEGEEFANINYVGDPQMTAQLAPEMDAVAPEFFARFHQAGLRTGICIRPSRIVASGDGPSKWQHQHLGIDPGEELSRKISYARKRLGCLLFYVDSNVRFYQKPDGSEGSRLLEAAVFQRLTALHPEVLIIPEIPSLGYWSCTAPYQELRPHMFGNHAATDARVREIYPRAFSVINPIDGPAAARRAELVAGQRRGDLLLFRCWFPDEQNRLFKSILQDALPKP
jgi:hypothetical protein